MECYCFGLSRFWKQFITNIYWYDFSTKDIRQMIYLSMYVHCMGIKNVNITFPQKLTKKVQIYLSHSIVKVLSKEIVAKSFHNHTFQILFCHRQKICVKVFLFCPLLWLFYIAIDTKKAWENQKSVGEEIRILGNAYFSYFFHMIEKRVSSLKLGHF